MMMATTGGKELSEYEKVRAKNVERNNAQLRALGLIAAEEEAVSNAMAWKKEVPEQDRKRRSSRTKASEKNAAKKRKRQADFDGTDSANTASSTGRKSLRLQGKEPDRAGVPMPLTTDEIIRQRRARVQECREVRMRRALEAAGEGAAEAAEQNGTASYRHCIMRIQSLTHKGLANRIRAIERAAGKYSVVKMALFKSCLQDEGFWELAELAGEALERLKALKSPEQQSSLSK
mmetsp:Transcript_64568/g.97295  ORF Transcript_64568/g.97295 Transcript_64568/m.97295 type:complete len:233 (-) Transcript_64568:5-703(-)